MAWSIGIKDVPDRETLPNIYCNGYHTVISEADWVDGDISMTPDVDECVYITDTDYTDVVAFKSAMKGKYLYYELATYNTMTIDGNEEVTKVKNDLDKLNSLPIGTIIQIEADKDTIATTEAKYSWQYLGTSNIQYDNGGAYTLVANVYRKNN